MYKFKNKLIKAQGGRNVPGSKYLYYKEPMFNMSQSSTQQPPSSPGNKFIDVNDVVDETKRRINTLRDKWNQRREERRAPYQEQYDELDEAKQLKRESNQAIRQLKKENRLSDRAMNKMDKAKRRAELLKQYQKTDEDIIDPTRKEIEEWKNENLEYYGNVYNNKLSNKYGNKANKDKRRQYNQGFGIYYDSENANIESQLRDQDRDKKDSYDREQIRLKQEKKANRQRNRLYREDDIRDKKIPSSGGKDLENLEFIQEPDQNRLNRDSQWGLYDYTNDVDDLDSEEIDDNVQEVNNIPVIQPRQLSIDEIKSNWGNYAYQDGGYIDESDFDYTEDVDLDDLNEYLRGGYLPKAQVGKNLFNKTSTDFKNQTARNLDIADQRMALLRGINEPEKYEYRGPDYELRVQPQSTELFPGSTLSYTQDQSPLGYNKLNNRIDLGVDFESKNADLSLLDKDGNPQTTQFSDYDPYKVYEPGNKVQLLGNMAPIAYNASRYLQKPIERSVIHDPRKLKKAYVTPDYTAVNEASNATANALRDNSRSAQGYLASRIASEMALAKQKNQIAAQATRENVQHEQNYLNQVNQEKSILDNLKQQWQREHIADKLAREKHAEGLVRNIDDYMRNKGEILGSEAANRQRIESMNLTSKDYKWERLPNGQYKVSFKGGSPMVMSEKQFADALEKTSKEEADKVLKEKEARIAQLEKDKIEANQRAKEREESYKREAEFQKPIGPYYGNYPQWNYDPETGEKIQVNKGAGAAAGGGQKKFGGWIKETNKPVKKRNRLYL